MGRRDRPHGPHPRIRRPRLPGRDVGPPRPGRARAAGGHAVGTRIGGGRQARSADPQRAVRGGGRRHSGARRGGGAALRHRRRGRLDGRGVGEPRPLRRDLRPARRHVLPLPGLSRQPAPGLRRRRRHRHQPGARRAGAGRRLPPRHRRALGRDDDERLHALGHTRPEAGADPHLPGRVRARPRLPPRPRHRHGQRGALGAAGGGEAPRGQRAGRDSARPRGSSSRPGARPGRRPARSRWSA